MLRVPLAATLLALSSLLAGCPESVHPLSDPANASHDPALFGAWHGTFDGDEIYLHVGPAERGHTRAVLIEHKQKGAGLKVERYTAFPSKVGKLAMLNVRAIDDTERERGYTLFKYEVAKDRLTLWMTSYAAVREDIQSGKLEGVAEEGQFGETRITASSAELVAYLQAADPKRLFDKPLVFRTLERQPAQSRPF